MAKKLKIFRIVLIININEFLKTISFRPWETQISVGALDCIGNCSNLAVNCAACDLVHEQLSCQVFPVAGKSCLDVNAM